MFLQNILFFPLFLIMLLQERVKDFSKLFRSVLSFELLYKTPVRIVYSFQIVPTPDNTVPVHLKSALYYPVKQLFLRLLFFLQYKL